MKANAGKYADFKVGNAFCGDPDYLKEEDDCSAILKPNFAERILSDCKGKERCSINLVDGLRSNKTEWPELCVTNSTQAFIQATC